MKELDFDGRLFFYKITEHDCGDYGAFVCYETHFYDTEPIIKERKKYLFFGPTVQVTSYKELFTLHFDMESPDYTKKEVRAKIQKQVDLLNRKAEIAKGEFV